MRSGVHEDADIREMTQGKPEGDVPLFFVQGHDAHLSDWCRRNSREDYKQRQKTALHGLMISERSLSMADG
jgi:hypothetical protein